MAGKQVWKNQAEFEELLRGLTTVSRSKIDDGSKFALKHKKWYKTIVHLLEKYIKSLKKTRVPALYLVDSIIRVSKAKFGAKDTYAERFSRKLSKTIDACIRIPSDQANVRKLVYLWNSKGWFSGEVMKPIIAKLGKLDRAGENKKKKALLKSRLKAPKTPESSAAAAAKPPSAPAARPSPRPGVKAEPGMPPTSGGADEDDPARPTTAAAPVVIEDYDYGSDDDDAVRIVERLKRKREREDAYRVKQPKQPRKKRRKTSHGDDDLGGLGLFGGGGMFGGAAASESSESESDYDNDGIVKAEPQDDTWMKDPHIDDPDTIVKREPKAEPRSDDETPDPALMSLDAGAATASWAVPRQIALVTQDAPLPFAGSAGAIPRDPPPSGSTARPPGTRAYEHVRATAQEVPFGPRAWGPGGRQRFDPGWIEHEDQEHCPSSMTRIKSTTLLLRHPEINPLQHQALRDFLLAQDLDVCKTGITSLRALDSHAFLKCESRSLAEEGKRLIPQLRWRDQGFEVVWGPGLGTDRSMFSQETGIGFVHDNYVRTLQETGQPPRDGRISVMVSTEFAKNVTGLGAAVPMHRRRPTLPASLAALGGQEMARSGDSSALMLLQDKIAPELKQLMSIEQQKAVEANKLNNTHYKIRACVHFSTTASCPFGDKCQFAHGPEELRMQQMMAMNNQGGTQKLIGDKRLGLSGATTSKTQICSYWERNACPYGDRCLFAHGSEDLRVTRTSLSASHPSNNPLWKSRICNTWEAGYCSWGDRCMFAHGEEELQKVREEKAKERKLLLEQRRKKRDRDRSRERDEGTFRGQAVPKPLKGAVMKTRKMGNVEVLPTTASGEPVVKADEGSATAYTNPTMHPGWVVSDDQRGTRKREIRIQSTTVWFGCDKLQDTPECLAELKATCDKMGEVAAVKVCDKYGYAKYWTREHARKGMKLHGEYFQKDVLLTAWAAGKHLEKKRKDGFDHERGEGYLEAEVSIKYYPTKVAEIEKQRSERKSRKRSRSYSDSSSRSGRRRKRSRSRDRKKKKKSRK